MSLNGVSLQVSVCADVLSAALVGEFDSANADAVAAALDRPADTVSGDIVVDLSGLTFMDSSGLDVLVALARRIGRAERKVSVVTASRAAARLFELTGIPVPVDGSPSVVPTRRPDRVPQADVA